MMHPASSKWKRVVGDAKEQCLGTLVYGRESLNIPGQLDGCKLMSYLTGRYAIAVVKRN
jgi:hypothetical protein